MSETQPAVELLEVKVDGAKEDEPSLHEWARGPENEWYYRQTVNKEAGDWNLAASPPPDKAELVALPKDKAVHDFRLPSRGLDAAAVDARIPGAPPRTEVDRLRDPREQEFLDNQEKRRLANNEAETARQRELAKLSEKKVAAMTVPAEPDQVATAELAREVKDQDVPPADNSAGTSTAGGPPDTSKKK